MAGTPLPLRFGVPPSLGAVPAATSASQLWSLFRRILAPELLASTLVAESYAQLAADLISGKLEVGWAPGLVCAQVEQAGGRALVRLMRGGAETYRSVFVCRADRQVDLHHLAGLKVAWVDPQSTAGYLVPRRYLQDQGVDLGVAFKEELFVGSYNEALMALLAGKVDLTVTFASSAAAVKQTSGLDKLPEQMRAGLRLLAHTPETPNDGVVASPKVDPWFSKLITERLVMLHEDEAGLAALKRIFDAERLVPAGPRAYAALYGLISR